MAAPEVARRLERHCVKILGQGEALAHGAGGFLDTGEGNALPRWRPVS